MGPFKFYRVISLFSSALIASFPIVVGSAGYAMQDSYGVLWNDGSVIKLQNNPASPSFSIQKVYDGIYQICPNRGPTQQYPIAVLEDQTGLVSSLKNDIHSELPTLTENAKYGDYRLVLPYIKQRFEKYNQHKDIIERYLSEEHVQNQIKNKLLSPDGTITAIEEIRKTPKIDLPIEAHLDIDPEDGTCTVRFDKCTEYPIQICLRQGSDGIEIQTEAYPWYRVSGGADEGFPGNTPFSSYYTWIDLFAENGQYRGLKSLEDQTFFKDLTAHIDDPMPEKFQLGRNRGTALYRAVRSCSPQCVMWLLQNGASPNQIFSEEPLIFLCLDNNRFPQTYFYDAKEKKNYVRTLIDWPDSQKRILQIFCCCPTTNLRQTGTVKMYTENQTIEYKGISLLEYSINRGRSDVVWLLALDYCFKQYFEKLEGTNHADFSHESIGRLVQITDQLFKDHKDSNPKLAQAYDEILRILGQISIKQTPYNLFMELRKEITKPDHTSYPRIEDLDVIYARSCLANIPDTSFDRLFQHLKNDCGLQDTEARDLSIRIWREQHPEDSVQKLAGSIGLPFKDSNQSSFFGKMKGFFGKKS